MNKEIEINDACEAALGNDVDFFKKIYKNRHRFHKSSSTNNHGLVLGERSPTSKDHQPFSYLNEKDSTGYNCLQYAVRDLNLTVIKMLVNQFYLDVNIKDNYDASLIHIIAWNRWNPKLSLKEVVENVEAIFGFLMEYGLSLQITNAYNQTPLHYAIIRGNHLIATILLQMGTPNLIKDVDAQALTVWHLLAQHEQTDIIKTIIDNWKELNMVVYESPTSIDNDDEEEKLNNLWNCQDVEGNSPLHIAAMNGSIFLLDNILQHIEWMWEQKTTFDRIKHRSATDLFSEKLDLQNNEGNNVLMEAVSNCQYFIITFCEKFDLNWKNRNNVGNNMLHIAAKTTDTSIVRKVLLLWKNKVQLDSTSPYSIGNGDGDTILHLAISRDNIETLKVILEFCHEEDYLSKIIERKNKAYLTPLMLAISEGNIEAAFFLIAYGADITAKNRIDANIIHLAAFNREIASLEFLVDLLELNCDNLEKIDGNVLKKKEHLHHFHNVSHQLSTMSTEMDRFSETALHYAGKSGNFEAYKILMVNVKFCITCILKNDCDLTAFHLAVFHNHEEMIEKILANDGAHFLSDMMKQRYLEDIDEKSNTVLHTAALHGNYNILKTLLEYGSDVSSKNLDGWTAIDCAAAMGNLECIRLLLKYNSPINPLDKLQLTPLHLASKNGHLECVKLLMKNGASVDVNDYVNYNCLDYAILNNHENVVDFIIESDEWFKALKSSQKINKEIVNTPLRQLIRKMPDSAKKVLDRLATMNETGKDYNNDGIPDMERIILVELIDDTFSVGKESGDVYWRNKTHPTAEPYSSDRKLLRENHPLNLMVNYRRTELLRHPSILDLLDHKWQHSARYVYYGEVMFYLIFAAFLTLYVVSTPAPYKFRHFFAMNIMSTEKESFCMNATEEIYEMLSNITSGIHNQSFECGDVVNNIRDKYDPLSIQCNSIGNFSKYINVEQNVLAKTSSYFLYFLIVIFIIKEICVLISTHGRYIGLECIFYWISFAMTVAFLHDGSSCITETGIRSPLQWSFGVVAIFSAWFSFVIFLQKFPTFGIFVVMFQQIVRTFMKFLIIFFFFIFSFAVVFYMTLQVQMPFETLPSAFMKTMVMMIGEYEFNNIFFRDNDEIKYYQPFYVLSLITFIALMFLLSLVVMNLLVGLAIDDIQAVMEQATLRRLAMKVKLCLYIESVIPLSILRKLYVRNINLQRSGLMNESNWIFQFFRRYRFLRNFFCFRTTNIDAHIHHLTKKTLHLFESMPEEVESNEMSDKEYLNKIVDNQNRLEESLEKLEKKIEFLIKKC
ncbi:hypothetical protein SNEBB_004577 [Seison nebaliae]|nr:hypothetical protein SNEBB_004577 [Seison nebaliae]